MGTIHNIILKPNERVVRVVRRVPYVNLRHYALAAFFLLLPFFLLYPLLKIKPWGIAVGAAFFCVGLFLLVRTIFMWYHNVFIVTTERIIDLDQRGFFEKVASQSSFDKVQDVSFHIHGALPTLLCYGDIRLKTGWGSVELLVPAVFRPAELQRLILDVQEIYLQETHTQPKNKNTYDEGEAIA